MAEKARRRAIAVTPGRKRCVRAPLRGGSGLGESFLGKPCGPAGWICAQSPRRHEGVRGRLARRLCLLDLPRSVPNTFKMLVPLLLAAAAATGPVPAEAAAPASPERTQAAQVRLSKHNRIIEARLVWHRRYDNCVRRNALDIARQDAQPETLARAAVAFCGKEELDLWSNTLVQCRALGEEGDKGSREAACAKRLMDEWRIVAERIAFACIAGVRFKPEAVGVSLCKMREP